MGRASRDAQQDIRMNHITREEGVSLVKKYDHVVSSDLDYWLDYVNMTEDEFWSIADTFRDPRVWTIENNEWYKENIWGSSSSYGNVNLTKEQIRLMSQVVKSNGIDGLICTNTSNVHEYEPQAAGMSGRNLLTISNDILSQFRELLGRDFPIIASGGVMDRSSYESKILCGADLVQVYTGIIFNGPGLIEKLANKT